MFNHDPLILGQVVGDPNYYPVDNGTLYFFKVQGKPWHSELRLFDPGVETRSPRNRARHASV